MNLALLRRWIYTHPVITILAVGVILRAVLFNLVGVNADSGLYLYDTKQLLEGQIPLIDQFGRSPLFQVFLSPAILLDVSPIVTARIQMILVSLTLGVVVYLATTKLHSHEAGVIAMAVFLLAPFELVWGLWLKTEQAAQLLILTGLLPLLGHLDADCIPLRDMVLLGCAIGAAFFARRVIVVHFGVILLFLLYYRWGVKGRSLIDPVSRGAVLGISTGLTILVGYIVWSGGSFENFVQLLNTHLVGLVSEPASAGNGAEGGGGILASIYLFVYGVVASNVASLFTYVRAVIVLLPVLLLLLVYPVVFLRGKIGNRETFWIFTVLGFGAILSGFFVHFASFTEPSGLLEVSLVAIIVGLGLVTIHLIPQFKSGSINNLWNRKLVFPASLAVAIVISYAVRDRGIFVTYFQDVFPYLTILTGVVILSLWREIKVKMIKQVSWASVLIIAIVISFSMATPLVIGPAPDYGATQFRISDVNEIGNDLNNRFGDGAQGFSAQPLYMLEANHSVTNNFSRKYWIVVGNQNSQSKSRSEIISETADELNSGETCYILVGDRTENLLVGEINKSLQENYRLVEMDGEETRVYNRTNNELYIYQNQSASC